MKCNAVAGSPQFSTWHPRSGGASVGSPETLWVCDHVFPNLNEKKRIEVSSIPQKQSHRQKINLNNKYGGDIAVGITSKMRPSIQPKGKHVNVDCTL